MGKKKTKAGKLTVGFCLDETGSMHSRFERTVSGFNEYVDELRRQKGETRLMLTQFSSQPPEATFRIVTVPMAAAIADVPRLGATNYRPRGNTPLYDAIGFTIRQLEDIVDDEPVMFVILTDGEENSSREWSREQVFDLITQKEKDGWRFVYLGVDQDDLVAERASAAVGVTGTSTPRGATLNSSFVAVASAGDAYRNDPTLTSAKLAHVVDDETLLDIEKRKIDDARKARK